MYINWFTWIIFIYDHIRPSVSDKCPGFFRISQETRAHENPKKHRQSERTYRAYSIFAGFGLSYARINRSGVNLVFYPLYEVNFGKKPVPDFSLIFKREVIITDMSL